LKRRIGGSPRRSKRIENALLTRFFLSDLMERPIPLFTNPRSTGQISTKAAGKNRKRLKDDRSARYPLEPQEILAVGSINGN